MRQGVDISNYTTLTTTQAELLRTTQDFVIVGLQDGAKARVFQSQLVGVELQWYVDRPGRDITIASPGDIVWIDIEPDCFVTAASVREQGTKNTSLGLRTGIYCNRTSIQNVFGDSSELADYGLPLWYANYIPPRWDWFQPFNGWNEPVIWQYSSGGFLGINCDLNVAKESVVPVPVSINGVGLSFTDGHTEKIWPREVI